MGVALEVLFRQDHFFPDSNSQPWGHQKGAQNEPKPSVQVMDDTLNKLTTQICDVRKVLLQHVFMWGSLLRKKGVLCVYTYTSLFISMYTNKHIL